MMHRRVISAPCQHRRTSPAERRTQPKNPRLTFATSNFTNYPSHQRVPAIVSTYSSKIAPKLAKSDGQVKSRPSWPTLALNDSSPLILRTFRTLQSRSNQLRLADLWRISTRHHSGHHHLLTTNYRAYRDIAQELKEGQQVTLLGLVVNIILTIGKGVAGVVGHSTALLADAVHSLGDLVSDGFTLLSHKLARKTGDLELYPYGRGKFESLGSLAVSVLLITSGLGIGYHSALELFTTAGEAPTSIALYAATASLLLKEALYHITMKVAKKQKSMVLEANAWHHRTDAISSVLALLGVAGEILGYSGLDALAGVGVAAIIARAGWPILVDSIGELVDKNTSHEATEIIRQSLEKAIRENCSDKTHIARLRVRKYGPHLYVDSIVHVDISPQVYQITQLDAVLTKIKARVIKDHPEVQEILIEVEKELQEAEFNSKVAEVVAEAANSPPKPRPAETLSLHSHHHHGHKH